MSHQRRKSDRKEVVRSSDESISGEVQYRHKESRSKSGSSKKVEKHKKSKKSSKYLSEVSSDSDGEYDSRKENKSKRKHKKHKSSKEQYEDEKTLERSDERDYRNKEGRQESKRKREKNNIPSEDESYNSKSLRKRSVSQERQRYGRWAETSNERKDASSRIDAEDSVSYQSWKQSKRNIHDREDFNRSNRHETNSFSEREKERKTTRDYVDDDDSYRSNKDIYEENSLRKRGARNYSPEDDSRDRDITGNSFRKKRTRDYADRDDDINRKDSFGERDSRKKGSREYVDIDDPKRMGDDVHSTNSFSKRESRKKRTREYLYDPKRIGDDVHSTNSLSERESRKKRTGGYLDDPRRMGDDVHSTNSFNERDSGKKRTREYVDLDDPSRADKESFEDRGESNAEKNVQKEDNVEPLSKRAKIGNINMRTGGAYIPPAKLRLMQERIKDKNSEEYQRLAWEALKKSIVGMTNKVNSSNITDIVPELFKENIIRGRGVLTRAIMQAQGASPTFTRVYAALVAIINTKFPEIGELILKRLIIQYKRAFKRNDKTVCMTAARFLAHLLNQEVAHEVLILEIVTHLLEKPTEDSVEIAIATLKECGKKLTQLCARGMRAITQRVREVLHEGNLDLRARYMIEVFFAVQKDGYKDFETVPKELDLVVEEDKCTHLINLDEAVDAQEMLNIFKYDPDYLQNEEMYRSVVKKMLGDSGNEDDSENDTMSSEEDDEDQEKKEENQQIIDMTETNVVCLRRKIYLTIQSSLDFEECAHKLLKLELKPGQILEMCYMILDCCAQQRTYEKFFGLLAQRFCQLNKVYVEPFTEIFENSYKTIHRLETNKLRNVAKFFAHLLYTDAISWNVLAIIKLNEEDTTSSSRIFIKILFQELCEYMGLTKLNERVKDVTLQQAFDGLFPRDHPNNTRFAINYFTSIGLGGLTDELRERLMILKR